MKNSLNKKARVLLTLHDVSPAYDAEIAEIIRDLTKISITKLNLAVVPCFDGRYDLRKHSKFCRMLENISVSFETELLLHGLYHTRTGTNQRLSPRHRVLSRLWSAGEDEFYQLDSQETEARIEQGICIFRQVFQLQPRGFIPPSWIFPKEHHSVLKRQGISYTESHFSIFQTQTGQRTFAPVMAFSTRSGLREVLSQFYNAVIKNTMGGRSLLRVALHPRDYHSAQVRATIIDVLVDLSQSHTTVLYRDLFDL